MNSDSARLTGADLILALTGAAAVLLVLPVIAVAGDFAWWMVLVGVFGAATVYSRRDSGHGLVVLGAVAFMWLVAQPSASSAWNLAVAMLMFTVHITLALRTTAPPGAEMGREVARRWLLRAGLVSVLTTAVYVLVFALRNVRQANLEVVLAVSILALGGLVMLLRAETLDAAASSTRRAARAPWRGRSGVDESYRTKAWRS